MVVHTCGPNEVMVLSGCCYARPKYINGGRVFVWPKLQKVQRFSLNIMTLTIESNDVKDKGGVPIYLKGIAQVGFMAGNIEMLEAACELFLNKTGEEIKDALTEVIQGHQSACISTKDVEDIYTDRKRFCNSVFEKASMDLVNMGAMMVSYTVHDLGDNQGFLKAIGRRRAQEAKEKVAQGISLMGTGDS